MKLSHYRFISDGIAHDGVELWWGKRMLCRMHPSGLWALGMIVLAVIVVAI